MASPAGQFHPWRLVMTFVVITVGLYALVFFTPGSTAPKLGIDLQGGTRVTLTARTADGSPPSRSSMALARDIMERRVNGSGVAGAQVQIDGSSQLVITVPGQDNLDNLTRSAQLNIRPVVNVWNAPGTLPPVTSPPVVPTGTATGTPSATAGTAPGASQTAKPAPDVSPSGTVSPTTATPQGLRNPAAAAATTAAAASPTPAAAPASQSAPVAGAPTTPAAPTASPSAIAGTAVPTTAGTGVIAVFPAGSDRTVPTQPAGTDQASWTTWETAVSAAYSSGAGPTCDQIIHYQGLDKPDKPLLACDEAPVGGQSTAVYLLEPTLVPGTQVSDATSGFDTQGGNGWIINVTFKADGFKTWSAYTYANVGKSTAFTLDGEVLSAPVIKQPINTPTTMVSGSFTQASAKALADSLKFGALPLAFDRQESVQVSAEVGLQSLQAGLIAGGIGLLLVVIYCLLYYRLLGLITILSLVLSGMLVYAVMVLLGRWINLSLDMAGIAGLIIAIGITADSFVVYFERIKDEVREGRTFRSSVPRGWIRAKRTILSADAVSFLSAAILYILAVGDVKGFAFTLGLSTVLDLVVVFLVTHPLVSLAAHAKIFTSPRMSGLGKVAQAGSEQRASVARLTAKEA